MKNQVKPTDSELEVLQVLWELGSGTVRAVNDELNKRKANEVGYTTTLKIMQIMHEKGLLRRNDDSRTHIYEAAVSEDETRQQLLDRFVDNVFKGSAMKLVMQALGGKTSSRNELSEIRKFLDSIEDQNEKTVK